MELVVPRGQPCRPHYPNVIGRLSGSQSLHFRSGRPIRRRRRADRRINVGQDDRARPLTGRSFGIHGQPDKTVCLMTYWHVDRHFSSCSEAALSIRGAGALSLPLIGRAVTAASPGPPYAAAAAAARAFIAAASRRGVGRVLIIRSHVASGRPPTSTDRPTGLSMAPCRQLLQHCIDHRDSVT